MDAGRVCFESNSWHGAFDSSGGGGDGRPGARRMMGIDFASERQESVNEWGRRREVETRAGANRL